MRFFAKQLFLQVVSLDQMSLFYHAVGELCCRAGCGRWNRLRVHRGPLPKDGLSGAPAEELLGRPAGVLNCLMYGGLALLAR